MTPDKEDIIYNLLTKIDEENTKAHNAILAEQQKTNGTVKKLNEIIIAPEHKDDGLVCRVNEQDKIIRKLEKSHFRFKVIYTPLLIFASISFSQWMEDVLRGTPWNINNLIESIKKLFGG